jgi:oligoendopeptidase F
MEGFMANNHGVDSNARWDLSSIYSGIDDPQIDADLAEFSAKAEKFRSDHKGKLADTLGNAITEYSELEMLGGKVMIYLSLQQSLDVTNEAVKAKMAHAQQAMSQAQGEHLTFFELELVAIEDGVLEALYMRDDIVNRHRPWIEQLRLFKPHLLSEPVEAALTKRAPFGPDSWDEFFDECEADLRFDHQGEKKNITEMLDILTNSKDAAQRAEVQKLVNDGLGGYFAKYSAQTLYVIVGKGAVECKERNYRNPMEGRNKSNRIPDAVVNALHDAVKDFAAPLARRYYRLKAELLGMKTLRWCDRNAPLPFTDTTVVPFEHAMTTVLAAYESFSPTLAGVIREFISTKRIDAPATKGKRGGAFNCSFVLPGNRPQSFTFLNYLGSNHDVMTLAHELGHGVHGILAGVAQGPLMFHPPIAYCETASVFGEMTTFNFVKERLAQEGDRPALLALITQKIEGMLNTVVRQIGFSNFERRIHGMDAAYSEWKEPTKLSVEELDTLWLTTAKELYGEEGEVFTYEDTSHLWSYVSHFHRPFYVYGYAFGELLTQSLYAQRSRLGDRFETLYLDLLRSGSTKNVVELLEPFGINATDKTFWAEGIRLSLEAMIVEAEELSQSHITRAGVPHESPLPRV